MSRFLEAMAQERWATLGSSAREIVALGFEDHDEGGLDTIVWYELDNVAGIGEFLIEPDSIERVLALAQRELVPEDATRYLWHSHYLDPMPSHADYANFPLWLVEAGIVFHAPSGTTTVYNNAGIIRITPQGASSLATPMDGG